MRPYLFVLLFTVYFSSCINQDGFRPELQGKIELLSKSKELGYNDGTLISYLKDSCSKPELLKLLEYKTPIIRILAYRAMMDRNEADFFSILKHHLSDTAKVNWWYYDDAVAPFTISDLMIRKAERKLSRQQKDILIDLVLKKHLYLETAKEMMQESKPQEKYYAIIRKQALRKSADCHDLGLTLALAKFKKQGDVTSIRSKLSELTDNSSCNDNIFRAIEIFPDRSFFVVLQRYFDEYIKKEKQSSAGDLEIYCRAVAQYQDPAALNILQALVKKSTYPDDWYLSQDKEYVFKSLYKYKSELYADLYNQLKPQMDKDVLKTINFSFKDRPIHW